MSDKELRSVSSEDVFNLASSFGVDIKEEPHLLPLIRQFLYTPLPPGWKFVRGVYVDELRGGSSPEHPARSYFTRVIAKARVDAGNVVSPSSQRLQNNSMSPAKNERQEKWIDLYDDNGNLYFEDILSGSRSLEAPAFTQVPTAVPNTFVATVNPLPEAPWMAGAQPLPQQLQFRAWFQECSSIRTSLIRREMTIIFVVATGQFRVKLSGTDKVYTISKIMGKIGAPLTHLDLHTGQVIDILGKPTTLMQADLITSNWIDAESRRLTSLKSHISAEMRKYGLNPPGSSTMGCSDLSFRKYKDPAHGDLRRLCCELEVLYTELKGLRPKSAANFAKIASRPQKKGKNMPFETRAAIVESPAAITQHHTAAGELPTVISNQALA